MIPARANTVVGVAAAAWLMSGVTSPAPTAHLAAAGPHPTIERWLAQTDARPTSYRAHRRLSAANKRFDKSGWVDVITEFDRTRGFHYEIVGTGGSEYIRRKVLVPVLEREQRALASDEPERAAVTGANYTFGDPDTGDDGLVRISILPRRKEELLVAGAVVLSSDGDLLRLEGRLARNPSFWTRRVDVVRRYARINGVRVPIEVTSTAQVFVAGTSSFVMCYDYETVDGTAVDSRTSCS